MTLDPNLHFLRTGYEQRFPPEYFTDIDDDGVTWQPDVYPETLALARAHGRDTVIDLGCGRAAKLVALTVADPTIGVVGVDYGSNIAWCRDNYEIGRWIETDLETATSLDLAPETVARSVIVCCDVLEHLVDPRPAMQLIHGLLNQGAARAVLSTPARDRRSGTGNLTQPRNTAHVREWAQDEFRTFIESFPLDVERAKLTRSDNAGGGLTTQLVVVRDAGVAR